MQILFWLCYQPIYILFGLSLKMELVHYKIPSYFITPSITNLLVCATTIISILITSLKTLGLSTPLFQKLKDPKHRDTS